MPPVQESRFGSKEIMRYVRVRQPRVIDLRQRSAQSPEMRALLDGSSEAKARARAFLESGQPVFQERDLRYDYFAHLTIQTLPAASLPTRFALREPETFPGVRAQEDPAYRADLERALQTVAALVAMGRRHDAVAASRLVGFIEAFPNLASIDARLGYPRPILDRVAAPPAAGQAERQSKVRTRSRADDGPPPPRAELARLSRAIGALWRVRNTLIDARRTEHERALGEILTRPEEQPRPLTRADRQRRAARRSQAVAALKRDYRDAVASTRLVDIVRAEPAVLATHAGVSMDELVALQTDVKSLMSKHGIHEDRFCAAFEKAVGMADTLPQDDIGAPREAAGFLEHPDLRLEDSIRVMGHADLIRVTETFMRYSRGEVSYIENILPGERRRRRVKSTKYFEQVTETVTEETTDSSREASVTARQDLSSQVETELNAKLSSDINATASGGGGGSLGFVDFEGSASAAANVSVGVDSRLSTQNKSAFSQEIINKAIEKTKSSTIERRLSRQSALHETLNHYEIDNTAPDATARNGIYCFLDKHVCITETVYGKRLFLLANIRLPGRTRLLARQQQLLLGTGPLGDKPVFAVSVDDIHPSTYKSLVARFKAANVSPPPPPVQTVARTYKTDTSNQNVEKQSFNPGKIADILTPFFERYQRYLVTDSIRLPDGYEVQDVAVTVNHGCNGISIPAHLPLKVAGATLGTGLTLASAVTSGLLGPAIMAPLAMWQFEYSVSPVLHYNTDSSHVQVCIGNQTLDSSYYFFDPQMLMQEVFDALGAVLASAPDLLDRIRARAVALIAQMKTQAAEVPAEVARVIEGAVFGLIDQLSSALSSFRVTGSLSKGFTAEIGALVKNAVDASRLIKPLEEMFTPLQSLIDEIVGLIREGVNDALAEMFEFLSELTVPSEVLPFTRAGGLRGELPVSVNAVTVNPGVTLNLVACLHRTEEALDKWRLDTFASLYQAYLQQAADYETKSASSHAQDGLARSPGTMRKEEQLALKELILHALNNAYAASGNVYSGDKMTFFENALDWNNLSFRLYNYGPSAAEALLEKSGVFSGADDRRRAFLTALWCQAMLPVQPDEVMEEKVRQYFRDGTFDFESGIELDDLTALYQDLVEERGRLEVAPEVIGRREEVIPTDLIMIDEALPTNPDAGCG